MQTVEELLAKLYRNLEKWLKRVEKVISAHENEQINTTLRNIDQILKMRDKDLSQLRHKYELVSVVASSHSVRAIVQNDDIARKATSGQSSSDELSISTLSIAVSDGMAQLSRFDIVSQIRDELKNVSPDAIARYLDSLDISTVNDGTDAGANASLSPISISDFDAIVISYVDRPALRAKFGNDIEAAKNRAIDAQVVSFDGDGLLFRAHRVSAYSSEKDIAELIGGKGMVRFEDIAPCIVVHRMVGSQYYFNTQALLESQSDPAAGLTKKFVMEHSTVIDLSSSSIISSVANAADADGSPPMSTMARIYGDAESPMFKIIDTIDGVNFAQLSVRGMLDVPRGEVSLLLAARVSREAAYNGIMEPVIVAQSHNVRAKAILHEYSTKSTDSGTTESARDLLRAYYREKSSSIVNRAGYIRAFADRITIMKILKPITPPGLSLHSTFAFERKLSQFVKKFEKNIYATAPADKEIDATAAPQTLFEAAFEAALSNTMKNADKNKIFARPEMSLVEFAKINSY